MNLKFQKACIGDLSKIVDIYNWAIINTSATFDTEIKTTENQLGWFRNHDDEFPEDPECTGEFDEFDEFIDFCDEFPDDPDCF